MTLEKLKDQLSEMAGKLIDEMATAEPDLALIFLAQARACIHISKDSKKLKDLWKVVNDGEHTLSNVIAGVAAGSSGAQGKS